MEITPTYRSTIDEPLSLRDILSQRAKTHGDYATHASATVAIKRVISDYTPPDKFYTDPQYEALHMIAHKLGRIIAGDADFRDHWDDIAGYAKLAADRCGK